MIKINSVNTPINTITTPSLLFFYNKDSIKEYKISQFTTIYTIKADIIVFK